MMSIINRICVTVVNVILYLLHLWVYFYFCAMCVCLFVCFFHKVVSLLGLCLFWQPATWLCIFSCVALYFYSCCGKLSSLSHQPIHVLLLMQNIRCRQSKEPVVHMDTSVSVVTSDHQQPCCVTILVKLFTLLCLCVLHSWKQQLITMKLIASK